MKIGMLSTSFVGRASGWNGSADWMEHDRITRERHDLADADGWLSEVAETGVEGVSIWSAHCPYHPVDEDLVRGLLDLADGYSLDVYSYAGSMAQPSRPGGEWFTRESWEATYELANLLGVDWIDGIHGSPEDRDTIRELYDRYGVEFAYENHEDRTAAEILGRINGYEDCMGVAFDTGWAGTQGMDAPDAIRTLGAALREVHLKDVLSEGGHATCALGDGVVDIRGCIEALRDVGYDGWVSIEHVPYDRDPMPELRESVGRVHEWLEP